MDGSPHAERALDQAVELARSSGARLTLITVAPELSAWFLQGAGLPSPVNPAAGVPLPSDLSQVHEQLLHEHRQILERAQTRVPDTVSYTTMVIEGRVGDAILDRLRAGEHDLVAMGSRRRGGLRSMVPGSVAHEVLHESPVPVLFVPPTDDRRRRQKRLASLAR
jgi:nucleotide-binding universal stress UspA family protein